MWNFHPVNPTKELYEKRMFTFQTNLKTLFEALVEKNIQYRGQICLKGSLEDYKNIGLLKFEFNDSVYIDFNGMYELHSFFNSFEWSEKLFLRIVLYNFGVFIKEL